LLKQGFMKQGRKVPKGKVWQCWLPNDEGMAYEGTSRPEAERLASKYGGTVKAADAQVDTDAAELANAYKTQGEAAARRLWAEKIKGLNYGMQIILQDKMAKLIKSKATDAVDSVAFGRAKESWRKVMVARDDEAIYKEYKAQAHDSLKPTTLLWAAFILSLIRRFSSSTTETVAPGSYDLTTYRPKRKVWDSVNVDFVPKAEKQLSWQISDLDEKIRKIRMKYGRSNSKLPALNRKLKTMREAYKAGMR